MYDVQHKVKTDYILKWIPHIELKRPPLEGDDLLLKRFEQGLIYLSVYLSY